MAAFLACQGDPRMRTPVVEVDPLETQRGIMPTVRTLHGHLTSGGADRVGIDICLERGEQLEHALRVRLVGEPFSAIQTQQTLPLIRDLVIFVSKAVLVRTGRRVTGTTVRTTSLMHDGQTSP